MPELITVGFFFSSPLGRESIMSADVFAVTPQMRCILSIEYEYTRE